MTTPHLSQQLPRVELLVGMGEEEGEQVSAHTGEKG
jgi:hypothetical protein